MRLHSHAYRMAQLLELRSPGVRGQYILPDQAPICRSGGVLPLDKPVRGFCPNPSENDKQCSWERLVSSMASYVTLTFVLSDLHLTSHLAPKLHRREANNSQGTLPIRSSKPCAQSADLTAPCHGGTRLWTAAHSIRRVSLHPTTSEHCPHRYKEAELV